MTMDEQGKSCCGTFLCFPDKVSQSQLFAIYTNIVAGEGKLVQSVSVFGLQWDLVLMFDDTTTSNHLNMLR